MTSIIDVHGAHILDFERFHLEHGEFEEAEALGYSVMGCVSDINRFLKSNKDNVTTILPPPSPIFNYMLNGGKFDFDHFPFNYENTQLLQIMTFISKQGLASRVIPYFGFSLNERTESYYEYIEGITKRLPCGFKFHPLAMGTPISSLEDSRILEIASERKMPILIHTGRDKHSDPQQLISLSKKYSKVKFCAAHFGYFRKEFLENISLFPNLFLDTSILSSLLKEIRSGNEKHVCLDAIPLKVRAKSEDHIFNWLVDTYDLEDKILFGSDIKWTYHVGSSRENEIALAEGLKYPKSKKEKWFFSNAQIFLGI